MLIFWKDDPKNSSNRHASVKMSVWHLKPPAISCLSSSWSAPLYYCMLIMLAYWNCMKLLLLQSLKKTKQSTSQRQLPSCNCFFLKMCVWQLFSCLFFWFKGPLRLGRYDSYASDRRVILIELRQHPVLVWKGAVQAKCHPRLQDARFLCYFFGGVVDFFGRFGHSNLVSQNIYLCIVSK